MLSLKGVEKCEGREGRGGGRREVNEGGGSAVKKGVKLLLGEHTVVALKDKPEGLVRDVAAQKNFKMKIGERQNLLNQI